MSTAQETKRKPYHHGDLRAALIAAAEAELIEKGADAFSLRGTAKRAGVSHAAPAHHFRDANALLDALAEALVRLPEERAGRDREEDGRDQHEPAHQRAGGESEGHGRARREYALWPPPPSRRGGLRYPRGRCIRWRRAPGRAHTRPACRRSYWSKTTS